MSRYIKKSHNVTVLLYHLVFPAKYRRIIFDDNVDLELSRSCIELESRYQINFVEIGTDKDHVHFLVQSVPAYSVTKIVTIVNPIVMWEVCYTISQKVCPLIAKILEI